ncbi:MULTISPECIES: Cro/CI family transcriptional regulator [Aeromonas]|uniref:Cro/CI family transcriptional regulator n=1 Tax=Aeromonas TaxID=642 RepID=UPI001C0491EA|nr:MULTISPECIES: Cro/CI family transcriptional regulator [Aeromonas]MDX7830326.1 Cro/CI family transcriptional regulator [Aeromonas dhakensis]QWL79727.1 helix-turn-helix domain-containing protein [Aeromonas hydrophila]
MKTELAVDYFGTKAAIADALGIKRSAVSQWGETIPKGRAYQIEVLTDGKLKADSRSTPQQPTPCV